MKKLIFCTVLSLIISSTYAQEIRIKGSEKEIQAIGMERASFSKFAKFLQTYIQKISQKNLEISNTLEAHAINLRLANKEEEVQLDHCEPEAFIIKVTPDKVEIIGKTEKGVEFGVYTFLEDYVGVNWLFPGELGEYLPPDHSIIIKRKNIFQNPKYISRQLSPIDLSKVNDLSDWGNRMKLISKISFHHNMNFFLKDEDIKSLNSDFFSRYNGSKYIPKSTSDHKWQPNFSSTGFFYFSVKKIRDYFNRTHSPTISLGINDNYLADDKYQLRNILGFRNYSEDYYQWVVNLVRVLNKDFPNKKYGLLAYYNVSTPPDKVYLNEQIIPFLTFDRVRWANVQLRKFDQNTSLNWAKKATNLGWYDYGYGYSYLLPRVYTNTLKKYLQWGSEHRVKYFYAEIYPNWGEGPKYWLLAKLLWNPDLDIDKLKKEWYSMCVGQQAAPFLDQYFSIWENYWEKTIVNSPWFSQKTTFLSFNNLAYMEDVNEEMMRQSDFYLNRVLAFARTDAQKKRAQLFVDMWELYKIGIQEYKTNRYKTMTDLKRSKLFVEKVNQLKQNKLLSNTMAYIEKSMNN
ncbi:DUF4838 domain-containing protein [Elizabethkingia argentiflava]|uniref:DUF4838 domain-containing protein n=1 Tax=Elizabethkingia argenteiflava TaxID=2681556 RepID=A0A845PZ47_9FLAO|nr:DUF4838 domain-containing protein [Elizabethkingia argenteiflava]NAW51360.1 DUF4838 domain-containing protein [Elizabethkingia argenteiflava]